MEAPEFFIGGYFGHFSLENRYYDEKSGDNNHFTIEDLLDFSKEDEVVNDAFFDNITGNSTRSLTLNGVDSCNASVSGDEIQFSSRTLTVAEFSGELCVPNDDLAELEWLSTFVEDSFSSDDLQTVQLTPATKAPNNTSSPEEVPHFRPETAPNGHNPPIFPSDVPVAGRARSKRSRAAPCDWSSRLLVLSFGANDTVKDTKTTSKKGHLAEPGRKCLHCASEKTPQWRTGPMGPKTLCNACGVRYKSGRLVPEYRPAASPTFMSTKHSNLHRKVLELRRRNEVLKQKFTGQSSTFGVSNGDEHLIHH